LKKQIANGNVLISYSNEGVYLEILKALREYVLERIQEIHGEVNYFNLFQGRR